jgi:hypothetical protein
MASVQTSVCLLMLSQPCDDPVDCHCVCRHDHVG